MVILNSGRFKREQLHAEAESYVNETTEMQMVEQGEARIQGQYSLTGFNLQKNNVVKWNLVLYYFDLNIGFFVIKTDVIGMCYLFYTDCNKKHYTIIRMVKVQKRWEYTSYVHLYLLQGGKNVMSDKLYKGHKGHGGIMRNNSTILVYRDTSVKRCCSFFRCFIDILKNTIATHTESILGLDLIF